MATLTVQNVIRAGNSPTYAAAAGGGDSFSPDTDTLLHVKNGGGGAVTVSVLVPGAVLGTLSIGPVQVSVPAGGERMLGPFPYEHFAFVADGLADITYSGVTSVTVAAFRITQP